MLEQCDDKDRPKCVIETLDHMVDDSRIKDDYFQVVGYARALYDMGFITEMELLAARQNSAQNFLRTYDGNEILW
jgi:hypothetical protein